MLPTAEKALKAVYIELFLVLPELHADECKHQSLFWGASNHRTHTLADCHATMRGLAEKTNARQ